MVLTLLFSIIIKDTLGYSKFFLVDRFNYGTD